MLLHLEESLALFFNGPGAFSLMQAWGGGGELISGLDQGGCCTRNGSTRWLWRPHYGDQLSEGLPPGRLSCKRRVAAHGFAVLTRERAQASHIALQFSQQIATLMTEPTPRFGFVAFAETWNGRLAMLGFVIGLGTELLTGQSILGQLGLG